MNRVFQNNSGSVAPLAILFTFISMLLMTAYLTQSATISSLEKYRFAEMRAQYVAEAGLNREAADFLPWLVNDTTLIGEVGVEFGLDTDGNPLGIYKNVACSTRLISNSTEVEYRGVSTGEVNYTTTAGSTVTVQKTVYMSMVPEGMGRFMYFTNEEEPFGPPNEDLNGSICFGEHDNLDGIIHTNGSLMSFCDYGFCPDISDSTVLEVVEGITIDFGVCSETDFQDDETGESIIDTLPEPIVYPPENSIENMRAHATREFTADDMITFQNGRQDTLIMTEIEFAEEGGFFATQWWYLIPPVCSSNQLGYTYDPGSTDTQVMPSRLQLMDTSTGGEAYTTTGGYSTADSLIIHKFDISGSMVEDILAGFEFGDEIIIESLETDKRAEFRISTVSELFDRFVMRILGSVTYTSSVATGFNNNEILLLTRDGDCNELNTNIEFNNFENYHDHDTATMFGPVPMCRVDGFQHFDFRYWLCSNRYSESSCVDENGKSFVVMPRTYFPYSGPEVIYIKGGQVLIRGTVKGAYTVLTDEVIQYRRHDNSSVDQVWGNVWLINDVRYADSASDGEVAPPEEGGTENVLGLAAGGSVIIANTRENGARSQFSWSDPDIVINAAIMALRGGFLSHYWQNQVGSTQCPTCYLPNVGDPENSLGDGRGLARNGNPFFPGPGENVPQTIDYRGTIHLWGQVVQQARGYMKRNNPGPYNGDDIGYDKNYHYDKNLYNSPPPYWPRIETEDGRQTLKLRAYGNRP